MPSIETAGVLIQTDGFMRDKPKPDGSNQRDKRAVQQILGAVGKAKELGLKEHLKRKKDPGIGHIVKVLFPDPTTDVHALRKITLFNLS